MTPVREAMISVSRMRDKAKKPETYRLNALWWRLHSMESKDPETCRLFSRNMYKLYKYMKARPELYQAKPKNKTDFQWSQYGS